LTAGGADGDIGTASNPLNTTTTTVNATASGTGEIAITETDGALTLNTVTSGTGATTINATDTYISGTITLSGLLDMNSSLILNNISANLNALNGSIDLDGNLTLSLGTLVAPSGDFAISGDFARTNGTFTHSSGRVIFDGAETAIISGSTIFHDFYCAIAGKQLTFTADTTQIIKGTLTLTGTAENRLLLRSSADETQWNIDPQGTKAVSYVDVKDSNNINSTVIGASGSKDRGNNTNWYLVDHFTITGTNPATAGANNELTITAIDGSGGTSLSFSGSKLLTFSGLSASLSGIAPTVEGVNFGTATSITFTDGVATAGAATLKAYKAEIATVNATNGTSSSEGYGLNLTVNPTSANHLLITGNETMAAGSTQELTITARDIYWNTATSYTGDKVLTFSGLSNSPKGDIPTVEGVNLGSNTTVTFVNGVSGAGEATLAAYCAETATLDVTDGTLSSGDAYDLHLTVNPANANYITYSVQPTNTVVNTVITPAVVARLYDTYGNQCANDNSTQVTIAIEDNPSGGILSGTTVKTSSSGTVTFNDLRINKAGLGYTLKCSSGIITPKVSDSFRIMSAGVARWIGTTSSDWNNASNWDIGFVPDSSYDIVIEGSIHNPRLDSNRTIDDLTIESGAILDLNSKNLILTGSLTNNGTMQSVNTLCVAGNWYNHGTFNAGSSSTVIFNGLTESIICGSTTFHNLECTTAGKHLTFECTLTYTIQGTLTLTGEAGNLIALKSTTEGTQWKIDPQGAANNVNYVDVEDSNNISGITINPANYIDSGNNLNWFSGGGEDPNEDEVDDAIKEVDNPYIPPITPPPPEEPDAITIATGRDLVSYEEGDNLKKANYYIPGRYRTVVIVFSGRVVVCPYGDADIRCKVLTDGEQTEQEAEIK